MPTTMRAKFQVTFVQEYFWGSDKSKSQETLTMSAVGSNKYDENGLSDDNTFAKFSPGGTLAINIANPALWDKFKVGQKFYLDFTEVAD